MEFMDLEYITIGFLVKDYFPDIFYRMDMKAKY